jgi:hypothetical protein
MRTRVSEAVVLIWMPPSVPPSGVRCSEQEARHREDDTRIRETPGLCAEQATLISTASGAFVPSPGFLRLKASLAGVIQDQPARGSGVKGGAPIAFVESMVLNAPAHRKGTSAGEVFGDVIHSERYHKARSTLLGRYKAMYPAAFSQASWSDWRDEMDSVIGVALMKYEARTYVIGESVWTRTPSGRMQRQQRSDTREIDVMTYLWRCMENAIIDRLRKQASRFHLPDDGRTRRGIAGGTAGFELVELLSVLTAVPNGRLVLAHGLGIQDKELAEQDGRSVAATKKARQRALAKVQTELAVS